MSSASREGRTLSVARDMERKSPVIMMITISIGGEDGLSCHQQANREQKNLRHLLCSGAQGIAEYALKRSSTHLYGGNNAAKPRLGENDTGG